ncbi:sigma-70 region 4 domain-containing protein, partial [bacterium]|nr:sigma-70 region 4 domain-containing protein [bacterium]
EGSCLHRDERMLNLLYERIHELSPVDRSLMLLSLDELGYQEIGAIHGLSSNVVGVRLHRLRKQILSDMKENFDDL